MSDPPASQAKRDDGARLLRRAARRRAVAADDLRLPETLRLSDRDRMTARALIDQLARAIEDELRAGLAYHFASHEPLHASLGSAHVEIAGPILGKTGALIDADLISLVLRRLEEHRLHHAARGRDQRLQALLSDQDAAVAAGAVAIIVGRSRRLDRFQEPVLARAELPAELQHRVAWTVAAALRSYLLDRHGIAPEMADAALGQVVTQLLAGYDEGDTLEARCRRLAQHLHALGRLDGAAIAGSFAEGLLPLFLAGLCAMTGLAYAAAWDMYSDPAGRGTVLLLKSVGLDRQQTAQILLLRAPAAPDDVLVEQIELFDQLSEGEAVQALGLWLLDPAYRAAMLRLDERGMAA